MAGRPAVHIAGCGRPPSCICEIQILMVGAVKRPILHQLTKFRKDRSNRRGDMANFVIFSGRHLGFLKIPNFNGRPAVRGEFASPCQILSKSVKRFKRFNGFQNGGRSPSWICKIQIFNGRGG